MLFLSQRSCINAQSVSWKQIAHFLPVGILWSGLVLLKEDVGQDLQGIAAAAESRGYRCHSPCTSAEMAPVLSSANIHKRVVEQTGPNKTVQEISQLLPTQCKVAKNS